LNMPSKWLLAATGAVVSMPRRDKVGPEHAPKWLLGCPGDKPTEVGPEHALKMVACGNRGRAMIPADTTLPQ
jgi:hypothetical protein